MAVSRKKMTAALIFIAVLAALYVNNKYRIPAAIRLTGTFVKPIFVNYYWDSGSGFNGAEENNGWLGNFQDFKNEMHSLEIGLMPTFSVSSSEKVRILKIYINRPNKKASDRINRSMNILKRSLTITGKKKIRMDAIFSSCMLCLENGNSCTKLYVKVDEQVFNVILTQPRMISIISVKKFLPGRAVNRLELPRLRMRGLRIEIQKDDAVARIEKLELLANAPAIEIPLPKSEDSRRTISINPKYLLNSKFHFLLFAVQVFLAFLVAWLWHELLLLFNRSQSHTIGAFLKWAFLAGQRWVFWGIFIFSFLLFSLWLLGQWPGEMNWDSFVMWRQTQTLELTNNHSFVYVLVLCLLKQMCESPASMVFFQIACLSFLLAWVYFFAFKSGAPKRWLTLFYIFTVASVPIAISAILVNFTTLFAVLTAFWGFYLFRLGFLKKRGWPLSFSSKKMMVLATLFYLLVSVRYHALAYILILPVLVWAMKVFPPRALKKFLVYFALIFVVLHFALATVLGVHKRTNYKLRTVGYMDMQIQSLKNEIQKEADAGSLFSETDRKSTAKNFLRLDRLWSGNDIVMARIFFREVLNDIPRYLAYRVLVFCNALGLAEATILYFQRGKDSAMVKMNRPLDLRPLISRPILPVLGKWQHKVLSETSSFKHLIKPRLIFWNTAIPLFILLVMLAFYGRFPLSACSSFFVLSQVPVLFFTMPADHWRYLYFIYLFGFLILPLVMVEYRFSSKGKEKPGIVESQAK